MKMSEAREQNLYNAIASRVMDIRIEIKNNPKMGDEDYLDNELFKLTNRIWNDVKITLNI